MEAYNLHRVIIDTLQDILVLTSIASAILPKIEQVRLSKKLKPAYTLNSLKVRPRNRHKITSFNYTCTLYLPTFCQIIAKNEEKHVMEIYG